jgi:hypothetical protein
MGVAACVVGVLGTIAKVRLEVVCRWFRGWGFASAVLGATLSCFRLERDEEGVGGVKSLFPVELAWDVRLNGRSRRRMELGKHHDAKIVCFEEKGPGLSHPVWNTGSKMCNLKLRVCQIEGTWWMESKC